MNTLCTQSDHMADVGLRIRVEPELRQEFSEACRALDLTASQVLRAYMREFVEQHRVATQTELPFEESQDKRQ